MAPEPRQPNAYWGCLEGSSNTAFNPLLTGLFAYAMKILQLLVFSCQEDEAMTSPQKLKLDSIVQRDADVIGAEADQDIVMVSIANGAYYGVSHVAREIWEAVENPKKISDLIGDLTTSYNIDQSLCEEQTLSFLEDLLAEGLLQVRDAQAS
jgi:Coenzyme PQQ synthesis protein D (PqqD)